MALHRKNGWTSTKHPSQLPGWRQALRWGLLLAWMVLIYRLSATPDLKTVPWAQRFHLLPTVLGVDATNLLEFVLRKMAHMGAFGTLWALGALALRGSFAALARGAVGALALLITFLYAVSDEWHQTFVPTRVGSPRDVAIDMGGALIACGIAYLWTRRRSREK